MIAVIYRLSIILLGWVFPCLGFAIVEGGAASIVNNSGSHMLPNMADIGFSAFDPSSTDISVKLLGKLFGPVGHLLSTNNPQLLGSILYIFNQGICHTILCHAISKHVLVLYVTICHAY